MKEAWDLKRDVLVQSGSFAIEQLSEALSTAARLDRLPDGVPQRALKLCAEKVNFAEVKYLLLSSNTIY